MLKKAKQVKLSNGWLIELELSQYGYNIKKIWAPYGHGIYHKIDTSCWHEGIWQMVHRDIERDHPEIKEYLEGLKNKQNIRIL